MGVTYRQARAQDMGCRVEVFLSSCSAISNPPGIHRHTVLLANSEPLDRPPMDLHGQAQRDHSVLGADKKGSPTMMRLTAGMPGQPITLM